MRPLARNASLALVSVLACLLAVGVVEVGARIYEPGYLIRTRGLHVSSSTYGWMQRPGVSTTIEGKRFTLSSLGHRGREVAVPKAGDRTRVVVLGDSVAFGLEVSDEETFASQLEARGSDLEIVSLAVQGFGPDQELLKLVHEGTAFDPDVVVLAYCLANDLADAVLPVSLYDGVTPKPRFLLEGERLVLDRSRLRRGPLRLLGAWLSDRSHLFNRTAARGPYTASPQLPHWLDRYDEALRDEDYAVRLNLALIREIDAVCRRRGVSFIVAAFPDRKSYRLKLKLARELLGAIRSEGIAVIDMAEGFRAAGFGFWRVAFDEVGHLRPRGHALAAQVLEREILIRTAASGVAAADR